MKHIANYGIGLALLLAVAGVPAIGQNQTPSNSQSSSYGSSLGDYARHIRKDPGSAGEAESFRQRQFAQGRQAFDRRDGRPAELRAKPSRDDSAAPRRRFQDRRNE